MWLSATQASVACLGECGKMSGIEERKRFFRPPLSVCPLFFALARSFVSFVCFLGKVYESYYSRTDTHVR